MSVRDVVHSTALPLRELSAQALRGGKLLGSALASWALDLDSANDLAADADGRLRGQQGRRRQPRRARDYLSAARAAASPGTPCTAPPGNVAALPMNSPFSGVEYGVSFGIGRKTTWRSR
jgi:hypothetical protein